MEVPLPTDEGRAPLPDDPAQRHDDATLPAGLQSAGDAAPVLQPGEIFGEYRIVRPIGRGGMGAVYEAEERTSRRRIALKVLAQRLASPDHRERFLREGRLTAAVNHPNSVYIFGTGESAGLPWIAMELVRGGTLVDHHGDPAAPDAARAVDAILQVIAGLDASARAGILHRDVKPSNCFVDADGSVKVGDFGLSISTTGLGDSTRTAAGTILGTPAYASPEQLRGEAMDARSDQYSVGATLYWMLCGRAPFTDQGVQLIGAILGRAAEFPHPAAAHLPAGLVRTVLRCLAKNPGDRFPDYASLTVALRPYCSTRLARAPWRVRAVAGLLDGLLASLAQGAVSFAAVAAMPGVAVESRPFLSAVAVATWLAFAVAEGRWGRTPGRDVCGLAVVGRRDGPPGIWRALVRGALFQGSNLSVVFAGQGEDGWIVAAQIAWALILFAPAVWGHAPLHDLVSATGVAVRAGTPRAFAPPPETVWATPPAPAMRCGPYEVTRRVFESETESVDEGVDAQLERRVWIHFPGPNAPGLDEARQNLARRTRPRWLQSGVTDGKPWNAYGMPTGMPFLEVARQARDWTLVRAWVRDAAQEMTAAASGTAVPPVDATRLWITRDGNLVWTDFPVVSRPPQAGETFSAQDLKRLQVFLYRVAAVALRGEPWDDHPLAGPAGVPLRVRGFLAQLAGASFAVPEELVAASAAAASIDTEVTRSRRAAQILCYAIVPMVVAISLPEDTGTAPNTRMDLVWAGLLGLCLQGFIAGVIGVIAAFVTREGVLLRLFGMGLIQSDGNAPSRARLASRSILCGLLCLPLVLAQAGRVEHQSTAMHVIAGVALAVFAVLLGCAVQSIRNPRRGPLEVLTRTRIVRR